MNSCRQGNVLYSNSNYHFEVCQGTLSDLPVVVKICDQCNLDRVDTLLKSFLPCKNIDTSPPKDVQVKRNKVVSDYQVKWVCDKQEDDEVQEYSRDVDFRGQKHALEEYKLERLIYQNLENCRPVEVREARIGSLERQVVVKKYHSGFLDLKDAIREALLMAKLSSLHTCKLLDIFITAGTRSSLEIGLVMEKLDADLDKDLLQRRIENTIYTEAELLQILEEITDALLYAKFHKVAHRDIKPANIFKDSLHYKLGDFGSACEVYDSKAVSHDGSRFYLSPEMVRVMLGEDLKVDYFQSDVYSLGVTMLHLAKLDLPKSIYECWRNADNLNSAVEGEMTGLIYSADFKDLLRGMLKFNPHERLRIEQIRIIALYLLSSERCNEGLSKMNQVLLTGLSREYCIQNELNLLKLLDSCKEGDRLSADIIKEVAWMYLYKSRIIECHGILKMMPEGSENDPQLWTIKVQLCAASLASGDFQQIPQILKISERLNNSDAADQTTIALLDLLLGICYMLNGHIDEMKASFSRFTQFASEQSDGGALLLPLKSLIACYDVDRDPLTLLKTVLPVCTKLNGEDLFSLSLLSVIHLFEGKTQEAQDALAKATERRLKTSDEDNFQLVNYYKMLGIAKVLEGQFSESEDALQNALSLSCQIFGKESLFNASIYQAFTELRIKQMRLSDAESNQQKAVGITVKLMGEDSVSTAENYAILARVYIFQNRIPEAETLLELTLAIFKQSKTIPWIEKMVVGDNLFHVYLVQGKWEEEELLCCELLADCWQQFDEAYPPSLSLLFKLANVYLMQGKFAEAKTFFLKVKNLSTQLYGDENPMSTLAHFYLTSLFPLSMEFTEPKEIEDNFQRTLEMLRRVFGSENILTQITESLLRNWPDEHCSLEKEDAA